MVVPTEAADLEACGTLLRQGSTSFHVASKLLPPSIRGPATALYAFCRVADDAIDGSAEPLAALAQLRQRLASACDGEPVDSAVDRAFARVLRDYAIPRVVPESLLEGFAWDANGAREYRTLADVNDYSVRVAGTVGIMMALLMRQRSQAVLARACDLGVAMQLTNIARDVGEDARLGRVYLPSEWLREAGIDRDELLARPRYTPALGAVVARLLDAATVLYRRASVGIDWLPAACRPGMHAARLFYADIGRSVRRAGHDSITSRARVAAGRKAALMVQAVAAAARPGRALGAAVLPEARDLVEAVPGFSSVDVAVDGRVAWTLQLFERLERADRARGGLA
jgi:15-cis-phytoene synthase